MALSTKVANLISRHFNQCISSTSVTAKKNSLKRELNALFDCDNDRAAIDYLDNLLNPNTPFSQAIDQKSGLGRLSSKDSNTRIQLNELLVKLRHEDVDSRLSSEVYDNICLKIDECIGSTKDEDKREALDHLKSQLLRQASDQEAINLLRNNLQNQDYNGFQRTIDKHSNSISGFREKQTNTRIQLQILLNTLSAPAPVNFDLHNWMSRLADNTALRQITMPGSHDAGVYDDPNDLANRPITKGASAKSWGICHELSIYNQCRAGVRYLDIRIAEKEKGQWHALHAEMGQGVWGAKADRMLDDLARFITENPTEVLFYKVTHTHDLQYLQHAVRKLRPYLCTRAHAFQAQNISLAEVELGRLRGKIVMLLENDEKIRQMNLQVNHIDIFNVTFPFSNLKGDRPQDTNPPPPYNAQLGIFGGNTGKGSVEDMIHGQLNKAVAFKALPNNYLFQMSWTQMGTRTIGAGDIKTKAQTPLSGNTGGGPHSTLPFLCRTLSGRQNEVEHVDFVSWHGNLNKLDGSRVKPNFIHMDFSCADNSFLIINLNWL